MELEIDEDEEREEEEVPNQPEIEAALTIQQAELPGISLHDQQKVIVMIDTDSMHNFININVARMEKILVEGSYLAMHVANGENLPCQGCHKTVTLKL